MTGDSDDVRIILYHFRENESAKGMLMTLNRQIRNLLTPGVLHIEATYGRVLAKLDSGLLLRADDSREHFCIMFLPLDPTSQQVLAVHHKKARKWLFPGGHIEPGESQIQTLNREVPDGRDRSQSWPTLRGLQCPDGPARPAEARTHPAAGAHPPERRAVDQRPGPAPP